MIHGIHIMQLRALEWIHSLPICISELPDSDNYLFTVRESGGGMKGGGQLGGEGRWGGRGEGEMVEDD